jgi:NTP pyrophosphatase (non-canonical NTP hydrolase)
MKTKDDERLGGRTSAESDFSEVGHGGRRRFVNKYQSFARRGYAPAPGFIKIPIMYNLISTIAERCHASATRRRKDTIWRGCIFDLRDELAEYWAAKDDARETSIEAIRTAEQIQDDAEFIDAYEKNLHNTVADELADVLIVAATLNASAAANNPEDFKPERDVEVMRLLALYLYMQPNRRPVRRGNAALYGKS